MRFESPLRILLAEDNPSDVDLIEEAFRKTGAPVEIASVNRLERAFEHLRACSVDVILLDLGLPDSKGIATLVSLRTEMPGLPIVVLTGNEDDDLALESLQRGAQDYLVKELFDGPTLLRSLRYAIERARTENQLAEAQRIAHCGSWEWNLSLDELSCSLETYRIYRIDPRNSRPGAREFLAGIHPDDRQAVLAKVKALAASGGSLEFEHRIIQPDGQSGTILMRIQASRATSASEARLAGTSQDVTEQRRVQAHLILTDRMASVGMLAAGVAHEINNPLAAVIANLDLMAFEMNAGQEAALPDASASPPATPSAEPADTIRTSLDDARRAAERVRQIVRDLKMFSKPHPSEKPIVNVRQVMESTLRMAWNEIRHRARLTTNYVDEVFVAANESRLGQVFLNLVVNAAQAIPEGNATTNEIVVWVGLVDGDAAIEITDTGSGIPAETLTRIFDPFFTTKAAGVGTGLGLAISQDIVSQLNGTLSATSQVGKGSTFRIRLPAASAAAAGRDGGPSEQVEVRPGPRGRVLLIDDDEVVLRAVSRTLAEHDVRATPDAREALEWIKQGERFDVIICDVMMPRMTGLAFHDELKGLDEGMAAGVIFLSGGVFSERARDTLDTLANLRVDKPFDRNELRALVRDRLSAVASPP